MWVITSDARPFYELQGFSVVRTAFIGANNPAWNRAPVVVSIVSAAATAFRVHRSLMRSFLTDGKACKEIPRNFVGEGDCIVFCFVRDVHRCKLFWVDT